MPACSLRSRLPAWRVLCQPMIARHAQVVFSPYLPAGFRYFTVGQGGVRGLPPAGAASVAHHDAG